MDKNIMLSGVQCTGKSTILNELKKRVNNQFIYIDEPIRTLKKQGIPINKESTDITQTSVMLTHYYNIVNKINVITNRGTLDGMAYTYYLHYISKTILPETFEYCLNLFLKTLPYYDYIFYFKPEIELVEDGVRSINKEFYYDMIIQFNDIIRDYNVDVITISGTIKQRLNKICGVINNE